MTFKRTLSLTTVFMLLPVLYIFGVEPVWALGNHGHIPASVRQAYLSPLPVFTQVPSLAALTNRWIVYCVDRADAARRHS